MFSGKATPIMTPLATTAVAVTFKVETEKNPAALAAEEAEKAAVAQRRKDKSDEEWKATQKMHAPA